MRPIVARPGVRPVGAFPYTEGLSAIAKLAPECSHCHTRVIGHGVEKSGTIFCCKHCADKAGQKGLRDRA